MNRKEFIKKWFAMMGYAAIAPIAYACNKENGSGGTGSATSCVSSPTETKGPYPTKNPTSYTIRDIKADRTGIAMVTNITIQNVNDGCKPLVGALVDVWHCDKDGNYSQYGVTASNNFLRGRQTTDSNGLASFATIFPGWYPGRAPHIHVEVFNAAGKSLLVTQIAFPTTVCDTVYTSATSFYTKGKQDTSNTRDGIFADSLEDEIATIEGSVANGYTLTHIIKVNG